MRIESAKAASSSRIFHEAARMSSAQRVRTIKMNIKKTLLVPASLALFAFLGLAGIPTTAKADDDRQPFSAICQSAQALSGDSRYVGHDCGPDANPNILVRAVSHKCIYLTDITVYGNNPVAGGGHEVDLEDVTNSRSGPPKVVFVAPWIGQGASVASQDWQTPIVFTGPLFADVFSANNNIIVTVSGFYAKCPAH
jgi:hypothetical protein